ncbi:MAG: hypothetical protein QF436_03160 [Candidatus Woesearchaeota archaeon]|jgi:hypothetical protein|nr:hypothetical protein [Candidatus Woesearchaeota archaeon]MDP7263689.1 hypothetical protein [Candidatus Woesearchaeota archaeon]MDP7623088.1 hypothetical protein [Candidatus Woesearchaeota archaeon]HJN56359.1 hypothetical protein [Candidatus Woesearchaeota archaeon]|tara:strand:+ start:8821 stop:9300 length:480 start_codon:yes stop_codon:yes gene_type:complete
MHNKKSQVQMMETIAVLFIFFVLIILGFVFYAKVLKGNIEIETEESVQLNAIKIAQRASFLPELQCSEENIVSDNCIDIIKLEAASAIMEENEIHYYDRLSFSKITIKEVYPDENEWMLYDRPLDDYSNKITTNIPISLLDPILNTNSFGIISVETFLK